MSHTLHLLHLVAVWEEGEEPSGHCGTEALFGPHNFGALAQLLRKSLHRDGSGRVGRRGWEWEGGEEGTGVGRWGGGDGSGGGRRGWRGG